MVVGLVFRRNHLPRQEVVCLPISRSRNRSLGPVCCLRPVLPQVAEQRAVGTLCPSLSRGYRAGVQGVLRQPEWYCQPVQGENGGGWMGHLRVRLRRWRQWFLRGVRGYA